MSTSSLTSTAPLSQPAPPFQSSVVKMSAEYDVYMNDCGVEKSEGEPGRHVVIQCPDGNISVGFNKDVAAPPIPSHDASNCSTTVLPPTFTVEYRTIFKWAHYLTTLGWVALTLWKSTNLRVLSLVISAFTSTSLVYRTGRFENLRRGCFLYVDEVCGGIQIFVNGGSMIYLALIYTPNYVMDVALNAVQWCVCVSLFVTVEIRIALNSSVLSIDNV